MYKKMIQEWIGSGRGSQATTYFYSYDSVAPLGLEHDAEVSASQRLRIDVERVDGHVMSLRHDEAADGSFSLVALRQTLIDAAVGMRRFLIAAPMTSTRRGH